ncbi:MAG: SlyX family protein [Alphaproteobacteria bacterium]
MSESERLTSVEIKLMHLEVQIEDMNSVVLAQEAEIARLNMKIKRAEAKMQSVAADGQESDSGMSSMEAMAAERPPHW